MDEKNQALIQELYGQLNGDAEHDGDLLMEWAERFRGQPEAGPLLEEIGRLLFRLDPEGVGELTQEAIDRALRMRDGALHDARRLCRLGNTERALEQLLPWLEGTDCVPETGNSVWMDFQSYLDGLLFQEYFEEEIAGREIRRHPLRPGELYYTCACLLVELGRYDEALEKLNALLDFDPVCPKYLFELTDVLKRTGHFEEAQSAALWALECASDDAELARCYRDLGYCLAEAGAWEDAAALYQLSIRFQPTPLAEDELRWIAERSGAPARHFSEDELTERVAALGVPVGVSEAVRRNQELLDNILT